MIAKYTANAPPPPAPASASAPPKARLAGIDADPRLPSQRKIERGRTVADPLTEVWEQDLLPILEREPAVQAVTLLRHLQQLHAERFADDSVRRTPPAILGNVGFGTGGRCTVRPRM